MDFFSLFLPVAAYVLHRDTHVYAVPSQLSELQLRKLKPEIIIIAPLFNILNQFWKRNSCKYAKGRDIVYNSLS